MRHLHKDYGYAFQVEPTKLTRLMDVIHDRLASHNADPLDRFEVYLSGNRVEELDGLDDLLLHENSKKKPIERLSITSSGPIPDGSGSDIVVVDFGVVKRPHNSAPNTNPSQMIAVSVSSPSATWASRTLSEVEEQIERTRVRYGTPLLTLLGLLILLVGLLLFQVRGVRFSEDYSKTMWLDDAGIQRVNEILSQGRSITEAEFREINTIQLRILVREQLPPPPAPNRTRKAFVLALPLVCLFVCGLILVITCYPKASFLWGDGIDRHNAIVQRRRVIWGIIIGIMVVGVFSKFLYDGLASLLP